MSNVKANAAICEICGGKLVLSTAENFECESCGANYPKDWVRAKVQEITGTVRIEGPVQIEGLGLESAEKLANNAETFIKLGKHSDAMGIYQKMQADYPNDYRGWWGAVRIRSNEFTSLELRHEDYDSILCDAKSAIKVAEPSMSQTLQNKLDEYVLNVYQAMVKQEVDELQNKKALAQKDLKDKQAQQENKRYAYSEAEKQHAQTQHNHTATQSKLAAASRAPKIVGGVLRTILGIWTVFLLYALVVDGGPILLFIIFGIPIFVLLPSWVISLIVKAISKPADKLKGELSTLSIEEINKKNVCENAKATLGLISAEIEKAEKSIQSYNITLSNLSKEQDKTFKEKYISGKTRFA